MAADLEKRCFKCNEKKVLTEFYKHSGMKDGCLNKCKECAKFDSKKRIERNYEKVQEYERQRANLPHRVKCREEYAKRPGGKEERRKYSRIYQRLPNIVEKKRIYSSRKDVRERSVLRTQERLKKYPYIKKAYCLVQAAVKNKTLVKQPCSLCGSENSHAHHEDYTKPLEVVWYCKRHHMDRHKEMRDAGFVWDELGRPVFKEISC